MCTHQPFKSVSFQSYGICVSEQLAYITGVQEQLVRLHAQTVCL
jgi:hypothetical protein